MEKSILQNNKECYRCKSTFQLHKHHVFYGTANRKKSDIDGCWIWLCAKHHNMSNEGIHFNKLYDTEIKKKMQICWEEYYKKATEDFIKRYGRNYK